MKYAICIRCGRPKRQSNSRCPNCKFAPTSDRDLAKSLILSLSYPIGEAGDSKSWEELLEIGGLIAEGQYEFDEKEVDGVVREAREALNLPVVEILKFLGPPFLLLSAMIIVVVILYNID